MIRQALSLIALLLVVGFIGYSAAAPNQTAALDELRAASENSKRVIEKARRFTGD
jgi:hypothetical protein